MRILIALLIFSLINPLALAVASSRGNLKPEEVFDLGILELFDLDVVTASKTSQKISDAPANITVVTKRQIRERGYVNLLDLVEDLPNVDVQRNEYAEGYSSITMRGIYGSSKFIIMMDGHRISSPTAESIPMDNNFPLYNAKQVEVIFGPASALYGADAFAGIINIITEDAVKPDGVRLSSSFGLFGSYYDYLHFGKKLANNMDLSFGGHWSRSDNADLSKYYPNEYQKTDLTTFGGNLIQSAQTRDPFYFNTGSYSTYAKLDIDDHFTMGFSQSFFRHPTSTGVRPDRTMYGPDVKFETLIRNYYGEYKFGITDNLSGKTSVSYLTYELSPKSKFQNIYSDFQVAYKYAHSKRFMLEQQVNYKLTDKHTLIGGVSWEDFYSLPMTADLSNIYNPRLPSSIQNHYYPGSNNTIPTKIFEINYSNIAGYIQAQSQWNDYISSTIGTRYDYNSRYGKALNPRAGLIIKPRETTTMKIMYGESYLAPSPYNAYSHFVTFNGTQNSQGQYVSGFSRLPNPNLEPEKLRTTEFSFSHEFTPNFNIALSGYYMFMKSLVFDSFSRVPSTYITGGVINSWVRRENLGAGKVWGADIGLDYRMDLGRVKVKYWGNYSYVDGHEDSGNGTKVELKYVANHKIKGGLTATLDGKYFITPMIRWIDTTTSQRVDAKNPQKRARTDSYVLVNLRLGAEDLFGGLSIYLDIHNLLDERYFNASGASANFLSTPQDPRTFMGTLEYKF